MAGHDNPDNKPQDWEKAVSAAYIRALGYTQDVAAKAAGIGERTLRRWEHCTWWPDVVVEAHRRWLTGIACKARGGILRALDDPKEYASTAKWVCERAFSDLAPPALQHEISGKSGNPIEIRTAKQRIDSAITRIAAAVKEESDPAESD